MKMFQSLLLVVGIQILCLGAFSQTDTELVKTIRAKLNKVNDYQADGKMKIDVSFIKSSDAVVKVYFKRPDKFAIKKEQGISILPKGGVHISLGSILNDDNYTVVSVGEAMLENVKVNIVKLLPGDENSDIVITTLYIDKKNLLIEKSVVTTKENGTYEMMMTYGQYSSWGLPDKIVFTFNLKDYKLPKGMTFEYESGATKPQHETPKNSKGKIEIQYTNYSINKDFADSVFQ